MRILNKWGELPCAIHCNGCEYKDYELDSVFSLILNPIKCPNNISIILVDNYLDYIMDEDEESKRHCVLPIQLRQNNIPFINGWYDNGKKFYFTYKVDWIYNALILVDTDYVLFLDTRDTKIISLDYIIDKFNYYNTLLLFCADKGNYPTLVTRFETMNNTNDSPYRFLNSGGFFGYTLFALSFFEKLKKVHDIFGNDVINMLHNFDGTTDYIMTDSTDLGFIRMFLDLFEHDLIQIDYMCKVFLSIYDTDAHYY